MATLTLSISYNENEFSVDIADHSSESDIESEILAVTNTEDLDSIEITCLEYGYSLTISQLAELTKHEDSIIEAAFSEYRSDPTSAVLLLENGYTVITKDDLVNDWLDSLDLQSELAYEKVSQYIDRDRLISDLSTDLVENADGDYIQWDR